MIDIPYWLRFLIGEGELIRLLSERVIPAFHSLFRHVSLRWAVSLLFLLVAPSSAYAEAYDVYCYGNFEIIKSIFIGVVMLVGSSGLQTLVLIILLLGLLYVIATNLLKPGASLMYVMVSFVIYSMVLVPKAEVMLIDLHKPNTQAISDVPLGLAFFASLTSTTGKWLTEKTEQAFSIPDQLKYTQSKALSHFRYLSSLMSFAVVGDPALKQKLDVFINECFIPTLGLKTPEDIKRLFSSSDLLPEMEVRVASTTSLSDQDGVPLTCMEIYSLLQTDIPIWAQDTIDKWKAGELGDASSNADIMLAMSQIISQQGLDQYKAAAQSALIKSLRANSDSYLTSADSGRNYASFFGEEQAKTMTVYIYRVLGSLAKEFIPYIRGVLEAVMYGVFLIVVLVALFPDTQKVVETYVKSLLWIQVWNPILAIINMVAIYTQKNTLYDRSIANMDGFSLSSYDKIASSTDTVLAITGLVAMSVPAIAWGLIKGGEVAMSGVLGTFLSRGERVLERTAMGDMGYGDVRMGNLTAFGRNLRNTSIDTTAIRTLSQDTSNVNTHAKDTLQQDTSSIGVHSEDITNKHKHNIVPTNTYPVDKETNIGGYKVSPGSVVTETFGEGGSVKVISGVIGGRTGVLTVGPDGKISFIDAKGGKNIEDLNVGRSVTDHSTSIKEGYYKQSGTSIIDYDVNKSVVERGPQVSGALYMAVSRDTSLVNPITNPNLTNAMREGSIATIGKNFGGEVGGLINRELRSSDSGGISLKPSAFGVGAGITAERADTYRINYMERKAIGSLGQSYREADAMGLDREGKNKYMMNKLHQDFEPELKKFKEVDPKEYGASALTTDGLIGIAKKD